MAYREAVANASTTPYPWQTEIVTGTVKSHKLKKLKPSTNYNVRIRARNAAGWGLWSPMRTFQTLGQPGINDCFQDDAPCDERDGEVQDVTFSHAGTECTGTPTVTLVGGNCWAYGVNETTNATMRTCGEAATAEVIVGTFSGSNQTVVVGFTLTNPGKNYTSVPRVVFDYDCVIKPSATAKINKKRGEVTSLTLPTPCLTPGGNMMDRGVIRGWRKGQGLTGDGFKELRTQMTYGDNYRCGWRIKPPVPDGYKLRFDFTHFKTEQGYDFVGLLDGEGQDWEGSVNEIDFSGTLPLALQELPKLLQSSGSRTPPPSIAQSGAGLLFFLSDESRVYQGGFQVSWMLQSLKAPEEPNPPQPKEGFTTTSSVLLDWQAPESQVPIVAYRLEYYRPETPTVITQLNLPSSPLEHTVSGFPMGTTYAFRIQAWAADVDASLCENGENYRCSIWSNITNVTTISTATMWYVSTDGSYFYGDGSLSKPFPMDIQGVIDRDELTNGHTIVLLPGLYGDKHRHGPGASQDLNLNGKLLSITSLGGATDTIIDCGGTGRFITFNNSEGPSVVLSGLTISNCGGSADGRGAILFSSASTPQVIDVAFERNVAEIGAAFVAEDDAAPTFYNCSFTDNEALSGCPAACTLQMRSDSSCDRNECGTRACGWDYAGLCCPAACDTAFADGICQQACSGAECGYDGGDCCDASCTATLGDGTCNVACNLPACGYDGGDCVLSATEVWGGFDLAATVGFDGFSKGGAGIVVGGASAVLTKCTLKNNKADLGGAFYVQGCKADRSSDAPCRTSALAAGRTSGITLVDTDADDNIAHAKGGVVYAAIGASVTLQRVNANRNRASSAGGAVWTSQSQVTVEESTLSAHSAVDGGALYATDSTIVMSASTLANGTSSGKGAGVLMTSGAVATFSNCSFEVNRAARGGALALVSTSVESRGSGRVDTYTITQPPKVTMDADCRYLENVATESGGAIDALGTDTLSATVTIAQSEFRGNEASAGTGGSVKLEKSALEMTDSVMHDGAAEDGGAIYAISSTLRVNSSTLRSNVARQSGGAVSASTSDVATYECLLANNSAMDGEEGGGAFYLLSTVKVAITNTTMSGNSAKKGGAISVKQSTDVTLTSSQISEGRADDGGGVYINKYSTLLLEDVDIESNEASARGGGVCVTDNSEVFMVSSRMKDNSCPLCSGGSMLLERSVAQVNQTHFHGNRALIGGAGHMKNLPDSEKPSAFTDCLFDGNVAESTGGGANQQAEAGVLYMYSTGATLIESSVLTNNSATLGGVFVAVATTSLHLKKCNMSDNTASEVSALRDASWMPL